MSNEFTFEYPEFALVTQSTLESYATNVLNIPTDIKSRMSWFFLADLYFFDNHKNINPLAVLDEIYKLEGLTTKHTGTKPASQFTGSYLKDLWHKHYMSARFIPQNIKNTLGKEGNGRLAEIITKNLGELDSSSENVSSAVLYKLANEIANEIVEDSLNLRKSDDKLTGEWIVFAKHDEQNYYLCMSYHDEGDQLIAHRIRAGCLPQFNFIRFGCSTT